MFRLGRRPDSMRTSSPLALSASSASPLMVDTAVGHVLDVFEHGAWAVTTTVSSLFFSDCWASVLGQCGPTPG